MTYEYKMLFTKAQSKIPGSDPVPVPSVDKALNELGKQGWRVITMSFPEIKYPMAMPQGQG